MSIPSEQEEEIEVLKSIFEGDDAFAQISDNEFQYKVGENGTNKSFLLTIKWPGEYPSCKPEISLDSFYNNHLIEEVKQKIVSSAYEEAEAMVGDAVTYTIIDWAKENVESLTEDQPDVVHRSVENTDTKTECPITVKKEKKEQLTKAQKRKLADKLNASGERPRGWNWVDIVKHSVKEDNNIKAQSCWIVSRLLVKLSEAKLCRKMLGGKVVTPEWPWAQTN